MISRPSRSTLSIPDSDSEPSARMMMSGVSRSAFAETMAGWTNGLPRGRPSQPSTATASSGRPQLAGPVPR